MKLAFEPFRPRLLLLGGAWGGGWVAEGRMPLRAPSSAVHLANCSSRSFRGPGAQTPLTTPSPRSQPSLATYHPSSLHALPDFHFILQDPIASLYSRIAHYLHLPGATWSSLQHPILPSAPPLPSSILTPAASPALNLHVPEPRFLPSSLAD